MIKRVWLSGTPVSRLLIAGVVAFGALASSANAQVVRVTRSDAKNAVGFNLGYFAVKGEADRVDGDVLVEDLNSLAFRIKDFSGFTFGGEYLYGIGDFVELGAGVNYYQQTVPSVYADFVNADGSEIAQDLKLRIVPITATVRFLPVGRSAPVQPFVGAGLGIFPWKYSEVGEFVDFSDGSIFRDRFSASGTAVGPVVLAGVRFPIGDAFTTGVEFRWQKAEGDTKPSESGLLSDKIDLGGWTTAWNMHIRF
jgi:opacity protein-like surface antigen